MKDNFDACLALVLQYEGGFVNNPHDPGGATNKGITLTTLRRYDPQASVAALKALSDEQCARIYRNGFWNLIGGDDLPKGLDLCVFDTSVNSGPGQARKWLARVAETDLASRIRSYCTMRLSFMQALKSWQYFGKGWARRVANVEARALKMAQENGSVPVNTLAVHAEKATKQAASTRKKATTTISAALTTQAAHTAPYSDSSTIWIIVAAGIVIALGAAFLAWRAMQHQVRADALTTISKET